MEREVLGVKAVRCGCLLVLLVVVGAVFGQDSGVLLPPQGDFRVDLSTNREVYHNKDIMVVTVGLLNESHQEVHIVRYDSGPVVDSGEVEAVEALADGEVVDAVVRPVLPTVIGTLRIVPLDYNTLDAARDNLAMPEIAYRLPLFGSPVIGPHSTRIVSTVNIWVGCPVLEPVEPVRPLPIELDGAASDAERAVVDVVGKYWALRPGRYLVEATIDRIQGVKYAQAQKIVRIGRRPVGERDAVLRLLRDNNVTIHKVDERTAAIGEAVQKDLMYAVYNSRYIRAIYRLLTGIDLPTPTRDAATTTTTTTAPTRTAPAKVVRTR